MGKINLNDLEDYLNDEKKYQPKKKIKRKKPSIYNNKESQDEKK
jgi:hypothetical protein